jgi:hypothetical protein
MKRPEVNITPVERMKALDPHHGHSQAKDEEAGEAGETGGGP